MKTSVITVLLISFLSLSCGVTNPVRTLPKGETQISGSLGGPLIPFAGTTIPVPYATLGIATGISDELTATASVHALMAALGNAGVDGGLAMRLTQEDGWTPDVVVKADLYLFSDLKELRNVRGFPRISFTGSYDAGPVLVYGGTDALVQFTGEENLFITPYAGTVIPLGAQWGLVTEVKWMAANVDTRHGILEGHAALGGYGNVGLFFGVTYGL